MGRFGERRGGVLWTLLRLGACGDADGGGLPAHASHGGRRIAVTDRQRQQRGRKREACRRQESGLVRRQVGLRRAGGIKAGRADRSEDAAEDGNAQRRAQLPLGVVEGGGAAGGRSRCW